MGDKITYLIRIKFGQIISYNGTYITNCRRKLTVAQFAGLKSIDLRLFLQRGFFTRATEMPRSLFQDYAMERCINQLGHTPRTVHAGLGARQQKWGDLPETRLLQRMQWGACAQTENRCSYATSPNSTAVANHVVLADHTRVMQQIIISIGRGPRMQHKRGNLP